VGLAMVAAMNNKPNIKSLEMNANSFGDDGIGDILQMAEELNLLHILGPFDDDEDAAGSDDEDEDEEAGDQNGNSENGNGEVDGHDEAEESTSTAANRSSLNGSFVNGSGDAKALSFDLSKSYFNTDAANLITLAETFPGPMGALLQERFKNQNDVISFVFGIASLTNGSSDEVKHLAQKNCDALLKTAFETKGSSRVTNEILEHLGVIKSERNIKKPPNMAGILSMLSVAVKRDWFPAESRSSLAFILEQRKDKVDADEAALTELMQGLALK